MSALFAFFIRLCFVDKFFGATIEFRPCVDCTGMAKRKQFTCTGPSPQARAFDVANGTVFFHERHTVHTQKRSHSIALCLLPLFALSLIGAGTMENKIYELQVSRV